MQPETIGVAMLGYAFMGHAHSLAYNAVPIVGWPLPVAPVPISVCGRDEEALGQTRERFGWMEQTTDWRTQVADERIGLFDNCGPNALHAEPTIAAAQRGINVFCEKPLALSAPEAFAMWEAAEHAAVVHMCALNYRFFPAIRLARAILESGDLGTIYHFRSRFLLGAVSSSEQPDSAWRLRREMAGSGVLGDLGAHHIDLARYLVGEPTSVSATTRTFLSERVGVEVDTDDAFQAILEFDIGATGTIEASRVAGGHTVHSMFEIDGSKGALRFTMARLNELELSNGAGFRTVSVTDRAHPFMSMWWPGHPLGWGDSFVHQIQHLLQAIAGVSKVAPHGATFEDGYRCAAVSDAIERSAQSGHREDVRYLTIAHAPGAQHSADAQKSKSHVASHA